MPSSPVTLRLFTGTDTLAPAAFAVIDGFVELEVRSRDHDRDLFQATFALGKGAAPDYTLLTDGTFEPGKRLGVAVRVGSVDETLIDGVTTDLQLVQSNTPGQTLLVVTGEDLSVKMDLEEKNASFPNQSDSDIVEKILRSYGLRPDVTATNDAPPEEERVPMQQGTDYKLVNRLAHRHGFVFYVEPGTAPGDNVAHWGPEDRAAATQPPISMNMGPDTNVDDPINFNFDALRPTSTKLATLDPSTREIQQLDPQPADLPPLELTAAKAMRTLIARDSAQLSQPEALLRGRASAIRGAEAVTATGELDAARYGHALRPRRVVPVRGAGLSFDGDYYVREVTHRIRLGDYRQHFTLARDGLGARSQRVNT